MKLRKSKKGFTVVELVIVIAVIAVLAAILIPTFISLDSRAKKASDQSLVSNLNTALAAREGEADDTHNDTMHDAVLDLEKWGYKLDALVTKSGEDLLWDSKTNRFLLSKDAPAADVTLWRIQKAYAGETAYSVYASEGFANPTVPFKVGFDAGYNTGITTITYDGDQDVVIRTNSFDTKLIINHNVEPDSDKKVTHYGETGLLDIQKVSMNSFHEKGKARVAKVAQGNLVVEEGAKISVITVTASDSSAAKVKVDGDVTTIVANQNVNISGSHAVTPVQLTNPDFDLATAVAILNGTAVSELPSALAGGELILLADTDSTMSVTGGTIVGNNTKLKATISGSGSVTFKDIYTTGLTATGFTGTILFDGGVLDNGGRGTADADAAIYLNSACTATFKNMTIAASLTKGIKASNVASITIDNCEFDATKLTIATTGNNSALQSLSLVDIQVTNSAATNISISNSLFKGTPQGSTAVPEVVSSAKTLADSDTGAAIKIKAENGYNLGTVSIKNNKFVNNYRDIVVGTAAYAELFQSNSSRCPERLCNNNKIDAWEISNNSTTLSQDIIENRAVATLSHAKNTTYAPNFDKFTTAADKCGELKGGAGVWVIANCYEKVSGTWYYLRNGVRHSVSENAGVVTFTPVA